MKTAVYHGNASCKDDRQSRLDAIKAEHANDPDFYSAYVDIAEKYNQNFSERPGYKSLMKAVYRRKVDNVFVSAFEDLNMSERSALHFLFHLKKRGVQLQIGKTASEDLSDQLNSQYFERLMEHYLTPLITFGKVYVTHPHWTVPFIYLDGDEGENLRNTFYQESTFSEVVQNYPEGFFVYMPEHHAWDFIDADGVEIMMDCFDDFYEMVAEDILNSSQAQ